MLHRGVKWFRIELLEEDGDQIKVVGLYTDC